MGKRSRAVPDPAYSPDPPKKANLTSKNSAPVKIGSNNPHSVPKNERRFHRAEGNSHQPVPSSQFTAQNKTSLEEINRDYQEMLKKNLANPHQNVQPITKTTSDVDLLKEKFLLFKNETSVLFDQVFSLVENKYRDLNLKLNELENKFDEKLRKAEENQDKKLLKLTNSIKSQPPSKGNEDLTISEPKIKRKIKKSEESKPSIELNKTRVKMQAKNRQEDKNIFSSNKKSITSEEKPTHQFDFVNMKNFLLETPNKKQQQKKAPVKKVAEVPNRLSEAKVEKDLQFTEGQPKRQNINEKGGIRPNPFMVSDDLLEKKDLEFIEEIQMANPQQAQNHIVNSHDSKNCNEERFFFEKKHELSREFSFATKK